MKINKARRSRLDDYDDMLSVKDLCEFLKISSTTAYAFIKEAPLVVVQVGREYKVSRANRLRNTFTWTNWEALW